MTLRGYITLGDCGCGGSPPAIGRAGCGCDDARTAWGLGGITADQAAQQAAALSRAWNSSQLPTITRFAQAGAIDLTTPGYQYCPSCSSECSGQAAPDLNLFVRGGTMALGVTGAGVGVAVAAGAISAAAGAIVGLATAGIGTIIGIYSIFHAHHAAAVAKEQSTLCADVPAANNYLKVIAQAVQQGAATPQQAMAALDSLLSDFKSAVAPILKMNSSQCNAACYLVITLTAIVNYTKGVYQDLANARAAAPATSTAPSSAPTPVAQPGPSGSAGAGPTPAAQSSGSVLSIPAAAAPASSSTTLPSWWPIAALAAVGFLIGEFA
jgi:hypothetical protein